MSLPDRIDRAPPSEKSVQAVRLSGHPSIDQATVGKESAGLILSTEQQLMVGKAGPQARTMAGTARSTSPTPPGWTMKIVRDILTRRMTV